ITNNVVTGAGPVNYIAQNGIQVGFGGTAIVKNNEISGNDYTPKSFIACGLLFVDADGVKASQKSFRGNQIHLCNLRPGGGTSNPNPYRACRRRRAGQTAPGRRRPSRCETSGSSSGRPGPSSSALGA